MKAVLPIIAISCLALGCAHRLFQTVEDSFVTLECVVEEFEPEALVFYDLDRLPYDARTRVSKVRVLAPASLVGRTYSIDLLRLEDEKDVGLEDLRHPGAVVRIKMPASLATNSEEQMIPIDVLKRELIQPPQQLRP
jgi:hypothetical protein